MKIAYIILAHKAPDQLLRMVKRTAHPDVDCWIHFDSKYEPDLLDEFQALDFIHLVQPRMEVNWGGYSTVKAMLHCMQCVMTSGIAYRYVHFMSGQDYPLKATVHFIQYLREHSGYEFIGHRPLEESQQNIVRVTKYYFNDSKLPGIQWLQRIVNKIMPDRKIPYAYKIMKGPQWMTLTAEAVAYILQFAATNPRSSGE